MPLFEGMDGAYICPDCIERGHQIVTEEMQKPDRTKGTKDKPFSLQNLPKPQQIKDFLDQYVIGQDEAKRYLSVAVYNHYKRLALAQGVTLPKQAETYKDVEIEKSNIIMVGPTGTGKTLIARTIAKMLTVPFTIVDATVLTEAGYVGEDVENILTRLYQEADCNLEQTERGIVFIDEIDLLEGSVVNVPPKGGRKHPEQEFVHINTQNILFICGGAFDGIERKIAQRLNTQVVGFESSLKTQTIDKDNLLQYIAPQDLKAFGLIPEIIGRLPILTYLRPLDRTSLRAILTEPKNAITRQYQKLLALDGVQLTFEQEALDYIVDKAIEYKLGARGLRSLTETVMMDLMYEIPNHPTETFVVTKALAEEKISRADTARLRNAI